MRSRLSKRKIIGLIIIVLVGLVVISVSIFMIYNTHKQSIVNQQKEQIITTAETASRSLGVFFKERVKTMDLYFDGVLSHVQAADDLYQQLNEMLAPYEESEAQYLQEVTFLSPSALTPGEKLLLTGQTKAVLGEYTLEKEGFFVLSLYKPLYINEALVGYVKAGINLNAVYDEILYPIQIGQHGYCTVKDRAGIILMHGTKSQIGINSRTDRKANYPDLDPVGVDRLIENQIRGESGSDLVLSYWWDQVELGKVEKIIGYTPVYVLKDFWVVSVIMDYSEIEGPLQQTLRMSILVGIVLVLFFSYVVFYITRELKNIQRLQLEWHYQAELYEAAHLLKQQEEKVQQYDRLQTLGILTGTIAHEFNNLMTPITIYCDLLIQKLNHLPQVKEDLNEIAIAAMRCADLSKQLLAYGRTEAVSAPIDNCDGAIAAKNSMKMIEKLTPPEIELSYKISHEPLIISISPGELNQILINLCTNAYQAMKGRGGKLKVTFLRNGKGQAQLIVKDTGCGMDQETMDNMYDAFFTTKPSNEGTGLGLSVVHRLVTKQGGSIRAESTLGEGTTFIINFPIIEGSSSVNLNNCSSNDEIKNKPLKILILDDKPEIIKSLKRGLGVTNWKIAGYTNPGLAYGKYKEEPEDFDILLTDAAMPNMNGFEFAKVIRSINPKAKIILMTGYIDEDLEAYLRQRVIDSYILKPIIINELLERVTKLMNSK